MEHNNSVWNHYKKDWVDPMYVPYTRTKDGKLYRYPPKTTLEYAYPPRNGLGWKYENQYSRDVCPDRWRRDGGYCVANPLPPTRFYVNNNLDYFPDAGPVSRTADTTTNSSFDIETGERKEYLRGYSKKHGKVVAPISYY